MDFFGTNQTGTLANDQDTVQVSLGPGQGSCLFVVNGTLKGTVIFEGSVDNSNWALVEVMNTSTAAILTSVAIDGSGGAITTAWAGSFAGFLYARIRLHPTTSGTGAVTLRTGSAPSPVVSVNALPAGTNNIGGVNMAQVGGSSVALGQAAMAASMPVVVANNQSAVPVSGTVTANGPTNNTTTAANAGTGVAVKASAGRLWSAVVTATGTAAGTYYDNASAASGTKLLVIPANAAVGTIYNFMGGAAAANGIYADQLANAPSVTVQYA